VLSRRLNLVRVSRLRERRKVGLVRHGPEHSAKDRRRPAPCTSMRSDIVDRTVTMRTQYAPRYGVEAAALWFSEIAFILIAAALPVWALFVPPPRSSRVG